MDEWDEITLTHEALGSLKAGYLPSEAVDLLVTEYSLDNREAWKVVRAAERILSMTPMQRLQWFREMRKILRRELEYPTP